MRTAVLSTAFAVSLGLGGCATLPPHGAISDRDLYTGFNRVDPDARTITPDSWLVVRNGIIEARGNGAPPKGKFARIRDMSGTFALPGLIDAHGHIVAGPQKIVIKDGKPKVSIATHDEYSRINGAVALAFGITSVRNPGGSATAAARYDAMVANGTWAGPEARHAGEILQPPRLMTGESFAYPTSPLAWREEAARQAALGMTYFKLYTDLTAQEVAEGAAAARANGLIPIAHLNAVSWTTAAEAGVVQLEHALPTSPDLLEPDARKAYTAGADFMIRWFELVQYDGPVFQEMVRTLRARRVAVDLTLVVNEAIYFAGEPDHFPELSGDLPDYMHPDVAVFLANNKARTAMFGTQLARGRAAWPKVLELARLLHEARIPMMIGTDGPGGGPTYALELHNHVRAGISPWEVLRMATSGNASLAGFRNTGKIDRGMEADVVFLQANPTKDVRNVREISLVLNNGEARTPRDLLDIARRIARDARGRVSTVRDSVARATAP